MSRHVEVMSGMAGARSHLIVAEGDIHAPVQAVLDAPMLAHGLVQARGIRRQTGDVEAVVDGRLALDRSLGGDHGKRAQASPALRSVQAFELFEGMAAPDFQAAVILLDDFVEAMR